MKNTVAVNPSREILIARICIALSLALFAGVFAFIGIKAMEAYDSRNVRLFAEALLFGAAIFFMAYGNLLYQICLVGYYKRRKKHAPAERDEIDALYAGGAPSLTVLVPSYKEEHNVIWQTLVSAALAEYPHKNVVLLVDNPYRAKTREDILGLEGARRIPGALQKMFDARHARFRSEAEAYQRRKAEGVVHPAVEMNRLSILYDEIAEWLETLVREFSGNRDVAALNYAERFFAERILLAPAKAHRRLAQELRRKVMFRVPASGEFIERQYGRVASLFNVTFSSFERKKYSNLSHEANKAMNLNSYIALVGKSWKEVQGAGGALELREVSAGQADFAIPAADYIDTLDADTVMLSDYALRLVHFMEQPENARIAVMQSPCSTLPDCPNPIERVAGACIDVQFQTHQGYTHWNATSWVGANAMLRYKALEDIKEIHDEDGKKVAVYIQDRTVIEDTESTIDLVEKGWELHNYPERMTFSPTPPDFGSLLIQRRRWANGGMIILPKLFSYMAKSRFNLSLLKEMFMRFHYLSSTTTVCVSAVVLFFYPFGAVSSSLLLPFATVPCLYLFARDLKNTGYRYSDVLRVWALTLMLFPVMIGGVLKQFQQMITGRKIPFGRTPKIPGRTAAPALYCLVELTLAASCTLAFTQDMLHHHWVKGVFSGMNAGIMLYALFVFMGFKATVQDTATDLAAHWKEFVRRSEAPLLAMRRGAAYLLPLARGKAAV